MPVQVLVVEDEPAIQELVAVHLEHAGHVGDHLVEVRVGVGAVGFGHLLRARQVQKCGIVNQQSRFLRGEVVCRPKLAILWQEEAAYHWADNFMPGRHLL